MTPESTVWLTVTVLRLLLPFSILRWPLGGVIACIVADTYDHTVFMHTGFGPLGGDHYQQWDKLLDTWYLFFLFAASRQWKDALARRTTSVLLAWRLIGVIALEVSGWRPVLVLTPNIIESFYLFWAISVKWFPFRLTRTRLALILIAVGIPKLYQEAAMHWLAPDKPIRGPLLEFIGKYR